MPLSAGSIGIPVLCNRTYLSMIRCKRLILPRPSRLFHTCPKALNEVFNPSRIERAEDEVDVCIVGGGPAGLSAAIRLKQLEKEKGKEIRVVVLEKGGEIGSHIVSGAVIEPRALDELLPSWPLMPNHPLTQPATSSHMLYLTPNYAIPIPHPPQMGNDGNYIVSLSQFTRWLGNIAEDKFGVEVYAGFAGAGLLMSEHEDSPDPFDEGKKVKSVRGVITNEVGLSKSYCEKSTFEPGMIFRSKVTLIAEGAHGSLSKQLYSIYNLRRDAQPQTYGIGLKEVWRVDPKLHKPGEVVHTMGWPLDKDTYGGGWVYHMDGGLVSLGLVIGLDYKNPWLSPYREFQRMKHHPYFRTLLSSPTSSRLSYAARVLNEGGLQSVPTKLHFPGGAIIGCSAGFVNVAKIKGTHNAMKSGMLAAEAAWEAVHPSTSSSLSADSSSAADPALSSAPSDLSPYTTSLFNSWIHSDLYEVRNLRPSFNTSLGIWGGILYSGIDSLFLQGNVPWTFKHQKESDHPKSPSLSHDSSATHPSSAYEPTNYPPFEPPLSTDLLTSVSLTGTNHGEDQPVHLRVVEMERYLNENMRGKEGNVAVGGGVEAVKNVAEAEVGSAEDRDRAKELVEAAVQEESQRRQDHVRVNLNEYAGLLGRACPAGVYEYVVDESGSVEGRAEGWQGHKLVINSQNCIHCKLCDIKVPTQDITWTVPEGGGGPKYNNT